MGQRLVYCSYITGSLGLVMDALVAQEVKTPQSVENKAPRPIKPLTAPPGITYGCLSFIGHPSLL